MHGHTFRKEPLSFKNAACLQRMPHVTSSGKSSENFVRLLQDFKTGHITMSSPRSMFIAQIAGAVLGKPFGSLPYL